MVMARPGLEPGTPTIFSRAALRLKQPDLQGFPSVLRLILRPDFPGLCVHFPGEKANGDGRRPFHHVASHAVAETELRTREPALSTRPLARAVLSRRSFVRT
jgi:hypothetical protein